MADTSQTACMIHHESVNERLTDNLILMDRKDPKSWISLLEMANKRNHTTIMDISKTLAENEIPLIHYHRQCRSRFMIKKDVEKISDGQTSDQNSKARKAKYGASKNSDQVNVGLSCMIHHENSEEILTDNLTMMDRKDPKSWISLLEMADKRNHTTIMDISKNLAENEIPLIHYHRQCRSRFMIKRNVEKMSDGQSSDQNINARKSIRRGSTASRVYDNNCIFCEKESKYKRGQRSKEKPVKCTDLRADINLREKATSKQDIKILAILSRDIVAAEAHYHRSCYKSYTVTMSSASKSTGANSTDHTSNPNTDYTRYNRFETEAFDHVFNFIRNELFSNPRIIPMTDLSQILSDYMKLNGNIDIESQTKKSLKRKLSQEFDCSLHFVATRKGKLLLYPYNLTVEDIVRDNHELKVELLSLKQSLSGGNKTIVKAAQCIRSDLKAHKVEMSWPPKPAELTSDAVNLPPSLKQFLQIVIVGDNSKELTPRSECLVKSLGQDFIYLVSKQKTPKHILLPYTIKSLTGNTELIKILNRLGHSVSYSTQEEIDTSLCLQKLAVTKEGAVPLPEDLLPYVPTMLAYDNIDRVEETLSGKGTSHRINGIAVQSAGFGPHPERPVIPPVPKNKQRSIEPIPYNLPIYNVGKRPNPPLKEIPTIECVDEVKAAKLKNLSWIMCRNFNRDIQIVNAWTGFNIKIRNKYQPVQDKVCYLPTINAPATAMSTVYEIMSQAIKIMVTLKLIKIVLVMDQALYAKACEVSWKHNAQFKDVILRMGIFHDINVLEAIIGIRFEDAGLRDICIETGIVAEGSVAKVMAGKMYNRATRTHKLIYEALMKMLWDCFLPWFNENHYNEKHQLDAALQLIQDLHDDVCQDTFQLVFDSPSMKLIVDKFDEFLKYQRNVGQLSAFWISYIDLVDILLALLRSTREGNWSLHLWAIHEMIPWCFAYDRHNYARYLSVYYRDMANLEQSHPDTYEHFMAGGFSVQLSSTNPFGKIPMDQTTEETVNKDTQTPGGTKGFSLKPSTISRYYMTAEFRSIFLRQMREMVDINQQKTVNHPDLQKTRTQRDEADVQAVIDILQNSWVNPFDKENQDLVSLSTATSASPIIANDLMSAREVGLNAYHSFNGRLSGTQDKVFHDTLPKQKLKTFSHATKMTKVVKHGPTEIILKADRTLFAHIIILAQNRNLSMREVLSHPLGPLPWSLATTEGGLRKNNKAALATEFEKKVAPAEVIPPHSACIIDGMAIVQKIEAAQKTFGDVAKSILSTAVRESHGCNSSRIDIVFDVYKEVSIKNAERTRRLDGAESIQYKNIAAGQNIQQWKKFMSNGPSKTQLITFIVNHWKIPENRKLIEGKQLFVTCEEKCIKMTLNSTEDVPDLYSSQEEADTRLFLHAQHASNEGYANVVIVSEDTDVFLLSMYYNSHINSSLFIRRGTQNRTRYVDIQKVCSSCGENVCKAILGLHSFTGCDTVSAFAGRGKSSALKLLKLRKDVQQLFCTVGETDDIPQDVLQNLEKFTCELYSAKTKTTSVNELRYEMFYAKKGEIESHQLPPCQDSLTKHVQRANYQTFVWKQSLVNYPEVPTPSGNGWLMQNDELQIDWMNGKPAPDSVLQFLACTCNRSCVPGKCVCIANGLSCTEMCKLKTCVNQLSVEDESDVDVNNDSDDDTSDDSE